MVRSIAILLLSLSVFGGGTTAFPQEKGSPAFIDKLIERETDVEMKQLVRNNPDQVSGKLILELLRHADRAFTGADYARALKLLQGLRVVAASMGNKTALADAWRNIGTVYSLRQEYQQALDAYQNSGALYEELRQEGDAAKVYASMAPICSLMGRQKTALEYLERSLKIHRENKASREIAQTLESMAGVYLEEDDYARASELYAQSLKLFEEAGVKNAATDQLIRIANLKYKAGRDEEAIDLYRRALAQFEERGERQNCSYLMHSLANIYYSRGAYPHALYWYHKGLKVAKETGNRQAEASAWQGIGLINSIYGRFSIALEAYRNNLSIVEARSEKAPIITALQHLAGSYFNLAAYDKALECYLRILKLREEAGNRIEIAGAQLDLGITCATMGRYEEAFDYYRRAREAYGDDQGGVADVLLHENLIHYLRGEFEMSLKLSHQAAEIAEVADEPEMLWSAHYREGKALYKLGRFKEAEISFSRAIAKLKGRLAERADGQNRRFKVRRWAPYLAMIDTLLARKQGAAAFDLFERMQAQIHLRLLQSGKVLIDKTLLAAERERERRLTSEIDLLKTQIERVTASEGQKNQRFREINLKLQSLNRDYERFKKRLYALHPKLAELRGEARPVTAADLPLLLTDPDSLLLQYVETDEAVYLFASTRKQSPGGEQSVYRLEAARDDLIEKTAAFSRKLADHDPDYERAARELYELLLRPVREQLADKTRLIIIPDGFLWNLPFHALSDAEGRFLLEGRAISYFPSMTAYRYLRGIRIRPPAASRRYLVCLDAAVDAESIERIRTVLADEPTDLSARSRKEAEALSRAYGERAGSVWSGAEATRERFKSEAGRYGVIHLALYGLFDDSASLQSSLTFADGEMKTGEMFNLSLNAESVVISGSESIPMPSGEGQSLTGLGWAWFTAGSQSVIVSRRQADPSATAELMASFYRHLSLDAPPRNRQPNPARARSARAWQAAVKELIAGEKFRHPYFWAGFTVLGE